MKATEALKANLSVTRALAGADHDEAAPFVAQQNRGSIILEWSRILRFLLSSLLEA